MINYIFNNINLTHCSNEVSITSLNSNLMLNIFENNHKPDALKAHNKLVKNKLIIGQRIIKIMKA